MPGQVAPPHGQWQLPPSSAPNVQASPTALSASVLVDNRLPSGRSNRGSGTVIGASDGKALVLTCKHLFAGGAGTVEVVFPGGDRTTALRTVTDRTEDLAVVLVPLSGRLLPATVAATPTESGTAAYCVGYSTGKAVARPGSYLQPKGRSEFAFSFTPQPGDSGGGVFRATDHQLIAVTITRDSGLFRDRQWTGGAVGRVQIRRFLDDNVTSWFPAWDHASRETAPAPKPPVPLQPSGPDFADVRNQIDALAKLVELYQVERRTDAAQSKADTDAKLEELRRDGQKRQTEINDLRHVAEQVRPLLPLVSDRLHQVDQAVSLVDRISPLVANAAPWIGWLPWIAGGAATGGAVPLLWLAIVGCRAALRRWHGSADCAGVPERGPAPMATPPNVVQVPMPSRYVPVPSGNEQLASLYRAMDEMVQRYPGAVGTVETLKKMAGQCEDPRKS